MLSSVTEISGGSVKILIILEFCAIPRTIGLVKADRLNQNKLSIKIHCADHPGRLRGIPEGIPGVRGGMSPGFTHLRKVPFFREG